MTAAERITAALIRAREALRVALLAGGDTRAARQQLAELEQREGEALADAERERAEAERQDAARIDRAAEALAAERLAALKASLAALQPRPAPVMARAS